VGLVGGMYNHQQAQLTKASEMREVYTKIMTERESSDNAIRAKMFEMLFNAMFAKGAMATNKDDFNTIKQRVMFLDVLSRNFDTVDIRPLFEDLDSELTKLVYSDNQYSAQERGQYFAMRAELRRIGKNLSLKQLNALASLPGTIVKRIIVIQDKDGGLQAISDEAGQNAAEDPIPIEIKAESIQDGMVEISLEYKKAKASDQGFKAPAFMITFYDLPYIDNSVIDKDMRVGVVLTKYVSTSDLERFRDQLDRKLIRDYEDLRDGGITQYAELRIIKFPAKYTGHRDRPYLSEILDDLVEGNDKSHGQTAVAR